jgi:hypothetical protein
VHEGVDGQCFPLLQGKTAVVKRVEDLGVSRRRHDHRDRRVVLGSCSHHRGPADVDLLDDIIGSRPTSHGLAERIQVRDEQVEAGDTQFFELAEVVLLAGVGEQAGVHLGMQGLDPAVQTFREAGQLLDRGDRDAGFGEHGGRRAGRDDLDTDGRQPPAELDQAGLVVHRDQRALDRPSSGVRVIHEIVTFLPSTVQP